MVRHLVLVYFFVSSLISISLASAEDNNENESGMVLVALGTQGGPQPNPFRAQPAHAIQVNGQAYLIDAGNGVVRQLSVAGIGVEGVRKIFITHNHDDHNADLGTLMGLSWSLNSRDEFDLYGPAGTREVVDGFLQSYSVNAAIRSEDSPIPRLGSFEGDFSVHNIGDAPKSKVIYKDKNVEVSAIENCHYHHKDEVSTKQGVEKSYAFRFDAKERSIVVSGDTGPCPQLLEFSRGVDLLVHEVFNSELMAENISSNGLLAAMPEIIVKKMMAKSELYHTIPEEVGKLANAAGVGKVVLTHVMPGRENDSDESYTAGVALHYSGEVVVARDLGRY